MGDGKVAIIIGGGSGIGKALATTFLQKGSKVCIGDVNEEAGVEVVQGLQKEHPESVIFQKCNVKSQEDVNKVFLAASEKFGKKVEVGVLTAAIIDEMNWETCIDINVGGAIRFINGALEHMGKDKGGEGGALVLTSSTSGVQAEKWGPVYSASKHAIMGLARSWADPENYEVHGIRINCACPSATETPFLKQVSRTVARHVEWHLNRLKTSPIFSPEEVVSSYLELIEDDSMNGQALRQTREKGSELIKFPDAVYV